jgi:hypothetical protein
MKSKFWSWKLFAILAISILFLVSILNRLDNKNDHKSLEYSYLALKTHKPRKSPQSYTKPVSLENNNITTTSKGEYQCKEILERLLDKKFEKVRPDFLRNVVTGKNLELDLYNSDLNLCVEFNGRQHYEYIPYFHQNKEAFYNQRYRDEMKKNKCKEIGINYLEVPYNIKPSDMENYIIKNLKDFGYNIKK